MPNPPATTVSSPFLEQNHRMSLPMSARAQDRKSAIDPRDTRSPGRHGVASQSAAVPTVVETSACVTSAHTPQPTHAAPTPAAPPRRTEAIDRRAKRSNAISRVRIAAGTIPKAESGKRTARVRRIGTNAGAERRPATTVAPNDVRAATRRPADKDTQNAVSR